MIRELMTSLRLIAVSMIVCCIAYPVVLLGFGQLCLPVRANGSLVNNDKHEIIGSSLIAQKFTDPAYFWPRPSACDYAANAAGASNLSPASDALKTQVSKRLTVNYPNATSADPVPADLVLASGSGLDPDITLAAAKYQAGRVAKARGVSESQIETEIEKFACAPAGGIFGGEPMVNVLELNIDLDKAFPRR